MSSRRDQFQPRVRDLEARQAFVSQQVDEEARITASRRGHPHPSQSASSRPAPSSQSRSASASTSVPTSSQPTAAQRHGIALVAPLASLAVPGTPGYFPSMRAPGAPRQPVPIGLGEVGRTLKLQKASGLADDRWSGIRGGFRELFGRGKWDLSKDWKDQDQSLIRDFCQLAVYHFPMLDDYENHWFTLYLLRDIFNNKKKGIQARAARAAAAKPVADQNVRPLTAQDGKGKDIDRRPESSATPYESGSYIDEEAGEAFFYDGADPNIIPESIQNAAYNQAIAYGEPVSDYPVLSVSRRELNAARREQAKRQAPPTEIEIVDSDDDNTPLPQLPTHTHHPTPSGYYAGAHQGLASIDPMDVVEPTTTSYSTTLGLPTVPSDNPRRPGSRRGSFSLQPPTESAGPVYPPTSLGLPPVPSGRRLPGSRRGSVTTQAPVTEAFEFEPEPIHPPPTLALPVALPAPRTTRSRSRQPSINVEAPPAVLANPVPAPVRNLTPEEIAGCAVIVDTRREAEAASERAKAAAREKRGRGRQGNGKGKKAKVQVQEEEDDEPPSDEVPEEEVVDSAANHLARMEVDDFDDGSSLTEPDDVSDVDVPMASNEEPRKPTKVTKARNTQPKAKQAQGASRGRSAAAPAATSVRRSNRGQSTQAVDQGLLLPPDQSANGGRVRSPSVSGSRPSSRAGNRANPMATTSRPASRASSRVRTTRAGPST